MQGYITLQMMSRQFASKIKESGMILGNISFVTLGNKDVHPLEMI
jgi:hypothetical protein